MNDELGDRVVYSPRGKNAEDDLADCILRATHIFMMGGELVWIGDGKRMPVVRGVVLELCSRFVVTAVPVNRGEDWVVEYRPFVPTELMVRNLILEALPKRAPVVQMKAPPMPEPEVARLPDDHPEVMGGRLRLARHAATGGAQEAMILYPPSPPVTR
jgi:hypothetical protein